MMDLSNLPRENIMEDPNHLTAMAKFQGEVHHVEDKLE